MSCFRFLHFFHGPDAIISIDNEVQFLLDPPNCFMIYNRGRDDTYRSMMIARFVIAMIPMATARDRGLPEHVLVGASQIVRNDFFEKKKKKFHIVT